MLDYVVKDAEHYARCCASASIKGAKRGTPVGRIKVKVSEMQHQVYIARMLGELSAAERILGAFRRDHEILKITDPQDH